VTEDNTLLGRLKARVRGHAEEAGASTASGFEVSQSPELAEALEKVAEKEKALKKIRRRLARQNREIEALRAGLAERDDRQPPGVLPENIVWIFGAGRTGSTWLAAMMEEMEGQTIWFEPRIGDVFDLKRFERYRGEDFILSARHKSTWLQSIRNFVLDGARARFPQTTGPDSYLMVKDPGGSVGAPLIMEVFLESRMVLLVRDPRDVAASWLDATKEGGWQNERRKRDRRQQETVADRDPDAFVERHAEAYLRNVGNAKQAYDAYKGRKVLIRYEDLRADTLGTMKRLYSALEIPVDERELIRAVEKHAWENIPEEDKGEGKFYRKASPGAWKVDLTPEQAEMVEHITAPLLDEFYHT
jgi:hypothetical protein